MLEDQESIEAWRLATFGDRASNARMAARANEEMAELLRWLTIADDHPNALDEVADVFIVLCGVASGLGGDLLAAVDQKMKINRERKWTLTAEDKGHGQHVREK